ncbi:alpha-L-arabinofuranosidase C-terminal domain-containing protein [Hungatella sp. SB206]|uniref:alpha-L-arabinofuranosidase C-terminal domain-containing protein n=1 Tax=Hungatella sp. SB206 TaxID=2937758 RepID=UPI003DA965B8
MNKELEEDAEIECDLRQFEGYQVKEHLVLTHDDLKAENTELAPDTVKPVHSAASRVENGIFTSVLGRHSWNVVWLEK